MHAGREWRLPVRHHGETCELKHQPFFQEVERSLQRKALTSPPASGDTLVVDGGAWLWRPPAVPRGAVSRASRGAEAASRATGLARKAKL